MNVIRSAVTSVFLSVCASIIATWLLRRLIFLADQPAAESGGGQAGPRMVVVVPMIIGNTVHGPTIVPPARKVPRFGRKMIPHR